MPAIVRQLGHEVGVQLNPTVDTSEKFSLNPGDQCMVTMMRATRGAIDSIIDVNRNDARKKLGFGESIRKNGLNIAWLSVMEALELGVRTAYVKRLVTKNYKIRWNVVSKNEEGSYEFTVQDDEPDSDFLFAFKHLECFNDGIKVEFHSDEERDESSDELKPTKHLTVRFLDAADDDRLMYEVTGSLDATELDAYRESYYLPDVSERFNQPFEWLTGDINEIGVDDDAYGFDTIGRPKWVQSELLVSFEEGGFAYTTQDYIDARNLLYKKREQSDGWYVFAAGTRSPAQLYHMNLLAYYTNWQLVYDVPGEYSTEAAIAFVASLNMGASKTAHYIRNYYFPAKRRDPTGINGIGCYGVASQQIAYSCARNAIKNPLDIAKKNHPIGGKDHPIMGTNIKMLYEHDDYERSRLAKAKINLVSYVIYVGGGSYVFTDILTERRTNNSLLKLTSVADMAQHTEFTIARFEKEILMHPMLEGIKRTKAFLKTFLENLQTSKWLVPSPQLKGKAFEYIVKPNEQRPYGVMMVIVKASYDGAIRQTHVTLNVAGR